MAGLFAEHLGRAGYAFTVITVSLGQSTVIGLSCLPRVPGSPSVKGTVVITRQSSWALGDLFRLRLAGRSSSYIRGHGSLSGIPSDPSPHQRDHCGHRDQRQTHYRRESVDKQDEVDGVLA
jgi:hypothetical protein